MLHNVYEITESCPLWGLMCIYTFTTHAFARNGFCLAAHCGDHYCMCERVNIFSERFLDAERSASLFFFNHKTVQ